MYQSPWNSDLAVDDFLGPPNMRLKLAGADRSKGTRVLCPSGHGVSPASPCAGERVARSLSAIR